MMPVTIGDAFAAVRASLTGTASAVNTPPRSMIGTAGINDSKRPPITIRTTTTLPQVLFVKALSSLLVFTVCVTLFTESERSSSIQENLHSPVRRAPLSNLAAWLLYLTRLSPVSLFSIFALTTLSPSIVFTAIQVDEHPGIRFSGISAFSSSKPSSLLYFSSREDMSNVVFFDNASLSAAKKLSYFLTSVADIRTTGIPSFDLILSALIVFPWSAATSARLRMRKHGTLMPA